MKIAACIICYYPDEELFKMTLEAIQNVVEHVYLWRNSPVQPSLITNQQNVSCLGDGTNQLIAKALNSCLCECKKDGFNYLLTMDQDSIFENCYNFVELASLYQDDKIIAYTPNINGTFSYDANKDFTLIDYAFTSGSLCNVDACLAIGGFREDYGIDWVDAEFCHRAKMSGYSIVRFPQCNLNHRLGGNYGPFRYYYIFRNMIWMHKEYPDNPSLKTVFNTYKYNLKNIFKSKNTIRNLAAVVRGSSEGFFNKPKKRIMTR